MDNNNSSSTVTKRSAKHTVIAPTRILFDPNRHHHIIANNNNNNNNQSTTTTTAMNSGGGDSCIIEYSVHTIPLLLRDDIRTIFPAIPSVQPNHHSHILFVMQPCSQSSMTEFTTESEQEKNQLLFNFESFAKALKQEIWREQETSTSDNNKDSWWFDYADPVSGYPATTSRGGRCFSDVDACEAVLRYRVETVGGTCRVLSHPTWSTSVYPSAIVTSYIPLAVIQRALEHLSNTQIEGSR